MRYSDYMETKILFFELKRVKARSCSSLFSTQKRKRTTQKIVSIIRMSMNTYINLPDFLARFFLRGD